MNTLEHSWVCTHAMSMLIMHLICMYMYTSVYHVWVCIMNECAGAYTWVHLPWMCMYMWVCTAHECARMYTWVSMSCMCMHRCTWLHEPCMHVYKHDWMYYKFVHRHTWVRGEQRSRGDWGDQAEAGVGASETTSLVYPPFPRPSPFYMFGDLGQ